MVVRVYTRELLFLMLPGTDENCDVCDLRATLYYNIIIIVRCGIRRRDYIIIYVCNIFFFFFFEFFKGDVTIERYVLLYKCVINDRKSTSSK